MVLLRSIHTDMVAGPAGERLEHGCMGRDRKSDYFVLTVGSVPRIGRA